jgi:Domain of unknown function (DUF4159)
MQKRRIWIAGLLLATLFGVVYGQRRGIPADFPFWEGEDQPTPFDANEKTEFVFARLMYPNWRSNDRVWSMRGAWTIDYPKADRQFVVGLRRLTRINARSVEQAVSLDTDEIMNYPWVYVVEPGHWDLTDAQVKKLREYLQKGGFLMTDDFHGSMEWDIFMLSLQKVFPDRPVVDLPNSDPIFHVLYDLDNRFQIPGVVNYPFQQTFEYDGVEAKWRGMYDEHGRLMVGICHNMDMGDAWEWADSPHYPERYASLAYRIGINYIMYAMSH